MSFNQTNYINEFNKNNYKMYQFRVKRSDSSIVDFLDNLENRNNFITSLIKEKLNPSVYIIKEIKTIIKPILNKYGIYEIYLFGSYARGEANKNSDIDIYCERGNIKTLTDVGFLEEELINSLNKKVDIVFTTSTMNKYFKTSLMEDLIKLC